MFFFFLCVMGKYLSLKPRIKIKKKCIKEVDPENVFYK